MTSFAPTPRTASLAGTGSQLGGNLVEGECGQPQKTGWTRPGIDPAVFYRITEQRRQMLTGRSSFRSRSGRVC